MAKLVLGESVVKPPEHGEAVHMPCFKLHNPRRILVTELTKLGGGVISLEQGQFDVQLGKPVEFIELIEIANKLQLVGAYAGSDFSLPILQVEQNLTSLRVMTGTGVEAELAVPVKQTAKRAADATADPLDQSIRDITHPKQPPINTSDAVAEELGPQEDEDEDEDDSADNNIAEEDVKALKASSSQAAGGASSSTGRPWRSEI